MALPVLNASDTEAQADDEGRNPDRGGAGRHVVHVSLVMDGVAFDAGDFYDALNTAYGTVGYEKDAVGRGSYIFHVSS